MNPTIPAAAILAGLFGLLVLYILFPWGVKLLLRRRFDAAMSRSDCACLTFDDGPNPEVTLALLALLDEAGAKATFFLVGENVDKHPELAREIESRGHELGEHSYAHTHAWKSGPIRTARDLADGGRAVERVRSSPGPVPFRPPYGKLNLASLFYVWLARRRMIFWNVDPQDYGSDSAEAVARYVVERLRPGAVVLLHDLPTAPGGRPRVTVQALRPILEEASLRGLTLTTVGDALSRKR